jgi:hypothetical protein
MSSNTRQPVYILGLLNYNWLMPFQDSCYWLMHVAYLLAASSNTQAQVIITCNMSITNLAVQLVIKQLLIK